MIVFHIHDSMLGRTHELGGIAALLASDIAYGGVNISTPTALLCIVAAFIGSLTPDLDKPTSLIYQKIPAGSFIGKIIHPIFIGGHRHISHSLLGFAIFAFLSHWLIFTYLLASHLLVSYIWISYGIGILSHFILDAMTTEGIPLFFPLPYKVGIPPVKALRIVTGSWVEHLIVFPFLIIAIGYMCIHYFSILAR